MVNYLGVIHNILISDVAGGFRQYLDLFFIKGCIHSLNANNPQYLDLIIVFKTIEELVEKLRDCLDDVENLINESRKQITEKTAPDMYKMIEPWCEEIDQRVQRYHILVDDIALEVE